MTIDRTDETSQHKRGRPRSRGIGCPLTAAVLFLCFLVFGAGLGLPYTYWLKISEVQAFESEAGVVLFVEVERTMRYGGLLQEPPLEKTMQMLQLEVTSDGRVSRTPLNFSRGVTFNTNVAPVVRLPDHFYLVYEPSCQLHRIDVGRIETLSLEESGKLLKEIGLRCDERRQIDDFGEFDRISQRSGWRRLNGCSYTFTHGESIVSSRHKLRVRFDQEGDSQAIVADSFDGPNSSSQTLVRVNSKRWKSYRSPMD